MYSSSPEDGSISDDLDCGIIDFTVGAPAMNINSTYRAKDGTHETYLGKVRWPQPYYGHLQLKF